MPPGPVIAQLAGAAIPTMRPANTAIRIAPDSLGGSGLSTLLACLCGVETSGEGGEGGRTKASATARATAKTSTQQSMANLEEAMLLQVASVV